MIKTERMKKRVRLLNQAEQIRQGFLVKSVETANRARSAFLTARDGKRIQAVRKFAASIAGK